MVEELIGGRLYVAELRTSTFFNVDNEVRKALPNPSGFGVHQGYWVIRTADGEFALEGNAEVALVIQYIGKTLKDAEEHAFQVGARFGSVTSAFGGYPLASPRLQRVAAVDGGGRLLSQHNYVYDDRLFETQGASFDPEVQNEYQRFLGSFSSYSGETIYRLQSAMHWYGIAISADDPAVAYVAAWTGLECIGPVMNSRFHAQGSRAACLTCGNQAGGRRDDTRAGIEHIFNSGTLESIDEFTFKRARQLRHDVVHGLREIDLLIQECSDFGRNLIDLLNVSILTALTPQEYNNSILSLKAGDYRFRPSSRQSILFNKGQVSPYSGEWIESRQTRETRRGTNRKGGSDLQIHGESQWIIAKDQQDSVVSLTYEEFRRLGQEEDPLEGKEMPVFLPWRDRPSEPDWSSASSLGWERLNEETK